MKRKQLIALPAIALALGFAVAMHGSQLDAVRANMAGLAQQADHIIAGSAGGELPAADVARIEEIHAKIENLKKTEATLEKQAKITAHMNEVPEEERFRAGFNLGKDDEKNVSRFSMLRFLAAVESQRPLDGIELEMAQEASKEAQRSGAQLEGYGIPLVALASLHHRFRNDMTATGQTSNPGDQGGTSIATDVRGLIAPLYSKTVLAGLGTSFLTGLVGNVAIPTFGDTTEQTEKAENADADEVTVLTGSVTLSPKRLPVVLDLSKQLLMQSSVDVEAWVTRHLQTKAGIRIDRMAINGSGSSNQPTGILNTSGIGSVAGGTNGAAPTWAHIVALETAVAASDADVGSLHYLTNPKVRGKLKTTEKFTGTNGMPVWENGNTLNGYGAAVSTVVPSTLTKGTASGICSAIIFGNFQDLIIAGWGGVDVQRVTDRANAIAGKTSIVVTLFYDAVVQRAVSFAAMKDALTT